MTYRVRKQALTGKLVLQHNMEIGGDPSVPVWSDAQEMPGEFVLMPVEWHRADVIERERMRARIAKYERRAKGQRDANEKRKAAISITGATQ